MAIKSKARHDLTLRSIKREIAAGRDVAYLVGQGVHPSGQWPADGGRHHRSGDSGTGVLRRSGR